MPNRDGLLFPPETAFVTGAARYLDAHPQIREPLPRIYVKFVPHGSEFTFMALLDTGGHYCVLNADVVDEIRHHLTERIASAELRTAHGQLRGELYRHNITLIAETGVPLDVESTLFVTPDWGGPSFLGYAGALERMRFAVDPQANRFYFGPLR